jgi:hypothetical protein
MVLLLYVVGVGAGVWTGEAVLLRAGFNLQSGVSLCRDLSVFLSLFPSLPLLFPLLPLSPSPRLLYRHRRSTVPNENRSPLSLSLSLSLSSG